MEEISNKIIQKGTDLTNKKIKINDKIRFIFTLFIVLKFNIIIVTSTSSIIVKYRKYYGRLLSCNDTQYKCDEHYNEPDKIKINDKNEEVYVNDSFYNLEEEENIVNFIWENDLNNLGCMFSGCVNITEIFFIDFDVSQVTFMSRMFAKCINLLSLDVSNFNSYQVSDMQELFVDCYSLTSLKLTNFKTTQMTKMPRMFANCYSLTSLDLSSFDTSQLINMRGTFSGCRSLTYLDLSNFNTNKVINMYYSFENCDSLTSLNLLNFNITESTELSRIINGCGNLSYIYFGNGTIENEQIISEFRSASSSLFLYINNETLLYLKSKGFNLSYEIWVYQPKENSIIITDEFKYIKSYYTDNVDKSNILDSTNNNKESYINIDISNSSINYNKTVFVQKIREDMIKGKYISEINKQNYVEFKKDNIIIELTNTENEKNQENITNNKTIFLLGICEYILKRNYNISNSSSLYILKIDIQEKGFKIPIIEYQIYNLISEKNLTLLNLELCKN